MIFVKSICANALILKITANSRTMHTNMQTQTITVPSHKFAALKMVKRVLQYDPSLTIGAIFQKIEKSKGVLDFSAYVYGVDAEGKLKGVLSLHEFLRAPRRKKLNAVMKKTMVTVGPKTHIEHAVYIALEHKIKAIPVVDENGVLLGVIPAAILLEVLHKEQIEDVLHSIGLHQRVDHSLYDVYTIHWYEALKMRLPWLLIGLLGGMCATYIMGFFENALEKNVTLAFFIPVIVYMADAVGTQTEAIFMRALALRKFKAFAFMVKEFFIGLCIALTCAFLLFLFALFLYHDAEVATIVAIALLATVSMSTIVASSVPWLLHKLHKDPALGSGPFATVLQDILSIVLYFLVATVFLF